MTKPAYLMTVEEIDKSYPTECAARRQALRAREHSFAMYDYQGKPIAHPNTKENLLKLISERDVYVVDSNSLYKRQEARTDGKLCRCKVLSCSAV